MERDGQAIDLTGLVVDPIKRPEDVLGELLAKGMMPDGLLLRLNRQRTARQDGSVSLGGPSPAHRRLHAGGVPPRYANAPDRWSAGS